MMCNEGFFVVWVWLFLLIVNFKNEGGKGDYIKIIMYIDFFLGGGGIKRRMFEYLDFFYNYIK